MSNTEAEYVAAACDLIWLCRLGYKLVHKDKLSLILFFIDNAGAVELASKRTHNVRTRCTHHIGMRFPFVCQAAEDGELSPR